MNGTDHEEESAIRRKERRRKFLPNRAPEAGNFVRECLSDLTLNEELLEHGIRDDDDQFVDLILEQGTRLQ